MIHILLKRILLLHKNLLYLFTIFAFSQSNGNVLSLSEIDDSNWNIIKQDKTWVGWTNFDGKQICQSKKTYSFPLDEIATIIEDKSAYANVFKRISKVQIFQGDIIHITLDMPFPFSNRDYVVKYVESQENQHVIYSFFAVTKPQVKIEEDVIRLINAEGEWRLIPISLDSTEVSYTWNGELLGKFPDWALTNAWETQGVEVLNWLEEALIKKFK